MHPPTILMTSMDLDIGGAETHVVTLSKQLKDLGYNIIIASNGGVYEEELAKYGIKHYNVSLNTKKIFKVFNSFFKLIDIIKCEKVDIIHAHARIPAFICNIVSKLLNVKFITTAHAKFRSNFILRHLSVWGEQTIAVSNDIQLHLTKEFGVENDKITVIPNGIDTEVFAPHIDSTDLYEEFDVDKSCEKIVWVSRVDDDLGDTIIELINSADQISKTFEHFKIFIVGSGNRLEEIQKIAQQKNSQFKKEVIKIVGKRTDINKLLNLGDIFIGISRAALEAMSCGKPTILAGPWSFVGLFNENNLEASIQDNFTGRNGSQKVSSALLAESIISVLNLSNEEKNSLSKFGRDVVISNYSSLTMAQNTAKIYENILKEN